MTPQELLLKAADRNDTSAEDVILAMKRAASE